MDDDVSSTSSTHTVIDIRMMETLSWLEGIWQRSYPLNDSLGNRPSSRQPVNFVRPPTPFPWSAPETPIPTQLGEDHSERRNSLPGFSQGVPDQTEDVCSYSGSTPACHSTRRLDRGKIPIPQHLKRFRDDWVHEALGKIKKKHLVILDIKRLEDYLLQVKVSAGDATYSVATKPWSLSQGRTVSREEFFNSIKNVKKLHSFEITQILKRRQEVFPAGVVRFILQNIEEVPTILMDLKEGLKKKIFKKILHKEVIPGSQRCQFDICTNLAVAVTARNPRKIYCARHVFLLCIDTEVLLYNPLVVDFMTNQRGMMLCANAIEKVYGPRSCIADSVSDWNDMNETWTRLAVVDFPKTIRHQYHDIVKKVLPECASYHYRCNNHWYGVDRGHSVICCLLEKFLQMKNY